MGRVANLKTDVVKSRELSVLKSMRGWGYIEKFLSIEAGKLDKAILNGAKDKIDECRGAIKFVRKFRVFLEMATMSGMEAAKELQKHLSEI